MFRARNDAPARFPWVGHERVESTGIYIHADMTIKERALSRTSPLNTKPGCYQASDPLLAFLEQL